jgi:glycosyltransferase involved in cell wall biosynthesis
VSTSRQILFVAPSAYRLGGLATWLDYLLPGLEASGWRATLGLVAGPRHHRPPEYLQEHAWDDVVEISCRAATERGRRQALRRTIRRLSPDVVCSVNVPDALAATGELRREGLSTARAVMSCHGIQPDLFADMRWLSSSLDAVVCTNRLASILAARMLVQTSVKVEYAPYGTALACVPLRRSGSDPLAVAYVGRFEQDQKRVSDVADIARGLAAANEAFRLIVAGDGPEGLPLRATLESCLSSDRMSWLGRIPANSVPQHVYHRADVLLLTSRWETGPIVVWEAMAQGVVVVSSRYIGSGCEGALQHRDNSLLFDVGDVNGGVGLIRELARDGQLRSRLAVAGRRLVEERYTIDRSVAAWDAALDSAAAAPPRPLEPPPARAAFGRLTRAVGPEWAERLRALRWSLPPDSGPGGEWPHTLAGNRRSQEFWYQAEHLDREAWETSPWDRTAAVR